MGEFLELETDRAAVEAFVRTENASTAAKFMDDSFEADVALIEGVLTDERSLRGVSRRGAWLYTFRSTKEAPHGLWLRRPENQEVDAETGWSTIFDVDAFRAKDGGDWHWAGAVTAPFDPDRVLLILSDGGSDHCRFIEFDCASGAIVPGGFDIGPERGHVVWKDCDTLLWASAATEEDATSSSWPGVVRVLRRADGSAPVLFRAEKSDLRVSPYVQYDCAGEPHVFVSRYLEIGQEQVYLMCGSKAEALPSPPDTEVRNNATHFAYIVQAEGGPAGALMLGEIGGGPAQLIWAPGDRQAADYLLLARDWLLWVVNDNMRRRVFAVRLSHPESAPQEIIPPETAEIINIGFHDAEVLEADLSKPQILQLTLEGPLTSPRVYLFDLESGVGGVEWRLLWRDPPAFDTSGLQVELREAASRDGERIPYHLVRPDGVRRGGDQPVMLYGYGGYGVTLSPWYNAVNGALWLARGGAYAIAYIRGGGELGPNWHLQAKGAGRRRSFDDFAAVAADLAETGLSSPARIGCHGASNGGLLTGVMLTQYPARFGAIWSSVGVLDMTRFHKFPAGRAWIDEYGDPDDPEALAWLLDYSPQHNIPDAATTLPPTLIDTADRDDRVDPSHARRFAASLRAKGHAPWFYEHDGGHGGGGSVRDQALDYALGYRFLARSLGL